MPFDEMVRDATRPTTIDEYMNKADQWGEPVAFDEEGRPTTFIKKIAPFHKGEVHGTEVTDIFWAPVDIDEDAPVDKGGRRQ
ncbi:MAG TPA: hypothetical protein VNI54_11635 [Thermoanaerobaculia bacterium]|nr:hypothetical protein [Thermoanaerobaculia bacterium]